MIIVVDVDYQDNKACVAGVCFEHWHDQTARQTYTSLITEIADYVPGAFYKRELPCILALLENHSLQPDIIIIDGYVWLDGNSKAGLGKHLYEALGQSVPIIGVAKSRFKDIPPSCELLRGQSQTPLYITAAGISTDQAKADIATMAGAFRIPTLLKEVDQLCRSWQT